MQITPYARNFAEFPVTREGAAAKDFFEERSKKEKEEKEAATAEEVHFKQSGLILELHQQLQTKFWFVDQLFRHFGVFEPVVVEVIARLFRQIGDDQIGNVNVKEKD